MKIQKSKLGWVFCLASLSLVGCERQNEEEQFALAQKALIDKNYAESEVILKNLIRTDSNNASYNSALGAVYFYQGKFENAEKEFSKVSKTPSLSPQDSRLWLQSMLFTDDVAGIRSAIKSHSNVIPTSTQTYYLLKSDRDFDIASVNLDTQDTLGILSACAVKRLETGAAEALACINESGVKDDNYEYLFDKANYSLVSGDTEQFKAAVLELNNAFADSAMFKILAVDAFARVGELEEAEIRLDSLLKQYSEQPFLNYLQSVIDYNKGNYAEAKLFAEKAISFGFDNRKSRLIAALSAYFEEAFEQSYQHFQPLKSTLEFGSPEYRIYAATLLTLGYKEEAVTTLNNMTDLTSSDLSLFSAASEYIQNSQGKQSALDLLGRFDDLLETGGEGFVELNVEKLGLDDVSALANLESLRSSGENSLKLSSSLANYYISSGDTAKALEIAEEVKGGENGEYVSLLIKALVELRKQQVDTAEDLFQQLLTLNEGSVPALVFFVDRNIDKKDYESARSYSDKLIEAIPNSILAVTRHLRVLSESGATDDIQPFLKSIYEAKSDSVNHAALYASTLLNSGNATAAIDVLSGFDSDDTASPLYWITLAKSQSLLRDLEGVNRTIERWVKASPNFKPAYLFSSNLLELMGDVKGSSTILAKAQRAFPNDEEVKLLLASNYVTLGNFRRAEREITQLSDSARQSPGYKWLMAQIEINKDNFEKASLLLESYMEERPSYNALLRLVETYRRQGRLEDAISKVSTHTDKYPSDSDALALLGELYIAKDHRKAIELYRQVVSENESNAIALNNLAWLLHVNDNNQEAEAFAKQAVDLAPASPDFLDTYGMILLRNGNVTSAVRNLRKALTSSNGAASVKLHLAEALMISGDKSEANSVLNSIVTNNPGVEKEKLRIAAL